MEGHATAEQHPALLDLVEASRWERLQDHFARVLGAPLRTIGPSRRLLVRPSWPYSLLNDQTISLLQAGQELEQLLPLQQPPQESTSLTTALGATYAVAPIRISPERIIAYFVVGPVVVGVREDELEFRQRVNAMGLDSAVLWPLMLSLKLFTFAGIRSVLGLLEEAGTSLAQCVYQAKEFAAVVPAVQAESPAVDEQRDRILQSLLETATIATRADGGSVMTFDAQDSALRIRAAQGLSDQVVRSTHLQRGEGIAGLAIAERTILTVDDQTQDARLRSRMRRGDVVSSIVVPLTLEAAHEPIGVLSLRSTTPGKRFTQEHVELLKRLLDLASAALATVRTAFSAPQPS